MGDALVNTTTKRFHQVSIAAFLALAIGTAVAVADVVTHHRHAWLFGVWLLCVLAEAIFFPWWGALLARRR